MVARAGQADAVCESNRCDRTARGGAALCPGGKAGGFDVGDFAGDDVEVRAAREQPLDFLRVAIFVRLGARPPHRGAFGPVQHPELDAGIVDREAHQPAERVDLADHLALCEPADRGVAGHRADFRPVERDQRDGAS
jgi:hypothetical protein